MAIDGGPRVLVDPGLAPPNAANSDHSRPAPVSQEEFELFREMNDHLRSTEHKHLQVQMGFLGATGVALSFLAQQTVKGSWQLLHTWSHVFAYFVLALSGCTVMWAQHVYRGWKKQYLLACKKLAASWPIADDVRVSWLRMSAGPYTYDHPTSQRTHPAARRFRVSGENGLYYFTLAVTSSLVAILMYSFVQLVPWWIGVLGASAGSTFFLCLAGTIAWDGKKRKHAFEREWNEFWADHERRRRELEAKEAAPSIPANPRPTSRRRKAWLRRRVTDAVGNEPALLIDLHNHTATSYDASNTYADYKRAFEAGCFDVVAITDHNRIEGALELQDKARDDFPVIVGQEVDTADGELIGLCIQDAIPDGLPAEETARAIKGQGGLVYLQHPYYRYVRRRVKRKTIDALIALNLIDIIEVANGGAFMGHSNRQATCLSTAHPQLLRGAGSDAHHAGDIGRCMIVVPGPLEASPITSERLKELLRSGKVVDCHRASGTTLLARAGYALSQSVAYSRGEEKKLRTQKTVPPA